VDIKIPVVIETVEEVPRYREELREIKLENVRERV
jgi:hypothetical protein